MVYINIILFALSISAHAEICESPELPFDKKLAGASEIFLGTVVSQSEVSDGGFDRTMVLRVDEVFKGSPAKKVTAYFTLETSKPLCHEDVFPSLAHFIKKKQQALFYLLKRGDKYVLTNEYFGGAVFTSRVKGQIKMLKTRAK